MPSDTRVLQDQLLRAMSAERKLLASEELRRAAWELKAAWIRVRNPELPPSAVQERVRRIFLDASA